MATYVMSDIHGQYDMFIELLDKINLKDEELMARINEGLKREKSILLSMNLY